MTKIKELKKVFEASTPGPWRLLPPDTLDDTADTLDAMGVTYPFGAVIPAPHRIITAEGTTSDEAKANTAFIALAHNMMPQLLEAVEMLRRARNLIGEAVNTHIYSDDETPDADCRYMEFLRDAKQLMGELK